MSIKCISAPPPPLADAQLNTVDTLWNIVWTAMWRSLGLTIKHIFLTRRLARQLDRQTMRLAGLRAREVSLLCGVPAIQPDGSLSLVFLTRRHQGVVSTLPVGGVATLLCSTLDSVEHVSVRVTHNTHVERHVAMVTTLLAVSRVAGS